MIALLFALGCTPTGKTFDSDPITAEGGFIDFEAIGTQAFVPAGAFPEGTILSVTAIESDAETVEFEGNERMLAKFGLSVEADADLEPGQFLWLGVPSSWGNNWPDTAGSIASMLLIDGEWVGGANGNTPAEIDISNPRVWMETDTVPCEMWQGFQSQ